MRPRALLVTTTGEWIRNLPYERLGNYLKSSLQKHMHIWTFLSGVTVCGLIFGAIVAGQLGQTDRLVLGNTLQHLFSAIQAHQLASGMQLWVQNFLSDCEILAFMWLFGVSVIGIPFVLVTIFLRAFTIGFSVGYTTLQFGWKGFVLSGVGIFLHQIVSLLAIFIAAVTAIRFSQQILQQRLPMTKLTTRFLQYTATFLLCGGGLMLGAFIQAYMVPGLLTKLLV